MSAMGRVGMTMLAAIVAGGCFEHTYNLGRGAPAAPVVYKEWHHHWLAGLIGERRLDIEDYCPSGNATIKDEQSFLNGLVAALTSGIYTPTQVTIRCQRRSNREVKGVERLEVEPLRNYDLRLSEQDVRTIASSNAFLRRVDEVMHTRADEVRALQEDFQER